MKRVTQFITGLAVLASAACGQGIITTVAGTPTCCKSVDGGLATSAWLTALGSIAMDRQGNLYIGEGSSFRVRKVNATGIITTVAGNGNFGYTGDGGLATNATLFGASGLAIDDSGNLFISDTQNHVIRKVDPAGIITTVAGNGSPGFSGDGGKATAAQLNYPAGIALDRSGNLFIADASNNRVRKVDTAGMISTFAGNGNVAYSGDGVQATATAVDRPEGITVDNAGNVYISETSDSRVRKVDPSGIITTIAGQTKKTSGFSGDGGPATAANLAGPIGMVVDGSGNLFIADSSNSRIRKVDAAGIITTFAGISGSASTPIGDGGPATSAFLGVTRGVALDPSGNLYLTSSAAGIVRIRKITTAGGLTFAPTSLSFSYSIGGETPASQTVSVTGGAGTFTTRASTTSGGNWLSATPASGTTPGTISVSVNPTGVPGGVYQGAVTITPAGGAAQTFAVTLTVTGAGAPTFSAGSVVNALGYQTKIAPDTVFVIFGAGMGPASLAAADAPNYPTTLGGTSVTFTPAGGGAPIDAKMVYSSAGQIAGLLPSSITPGTYAVRVTYNSLTSPPQNVTVVARSFGIATANSAGTGTAQATIGNVNGGVSLTRFTSGSVAFGGHTWTLSPAHPGDTLVLWGTGGGADPANDTGGSSGDQTQAGGFSVVVGGRSIIPLYAGSSSGYPGLWQINFNLPADITPDCFASVQVSAGGELSNLVTIPIAPSGQSACSDSQLSTTALAALDAGGTVVVGGFGISRVSSTTTFLPPSGGAPTVTSATQEGVGGAFLVYTAAEYAAVFSGTKVGPCKITDNITSPNIRNPAQPDGYLDAGALLPVSGPGLSPAAALGIASANPGPIYSLLLTNGTINAGGSYSVKGNGGKGVGGFNATVSFPGSFSVMGFDTLSSIDRAKPLTLNWTGTGLDQVVIIGSTSSVIGKDAQNANLVRTVAFTCQVPGGPGTYTIPTAVLSRLLPEGLDTASLAKGAGILVVEAVNQQPFTVSTTAGTPVSAGFSATLGYSRNLAVQ